MGGSIPGVRVTWNITVPGSTPGVRVNWNTREDWFILISETKKTEQEAVLSNSVILTTEHLMCKVITWFVKNSTLLQEAFIYCDFYRGCQCIEMLVVIPLSVLQLAWRRWLPTRRVTIIRPYSSMINKMMELMGTKLVKNRNGGYYRG